MSQAHVLLTIANLNRERHETLVRVVICFQTTFLTELKFLCLTSILTTAYSWQQVAKADVSCALLHSRRNSSVLHTKLSARNHEIGQAKERIRPWRILGEHTLPNLHQTQQVLDNVKRMFDLGVNTRLVVARSSPGFAPTAYQAVHGVFQGASQHASEAFSV